ncbi:hypothetical protein GPECTOR_10g1070 [Gonium pectorale]|uniref:tRNA/rRNA methyltransferase SpoU type domain-containing protein n=1 Tax=Gonium pectorale TaxID=33097 RepID=A0A150GQC8_GONPE|nr:hypothetical protein GPECTOR_10g1070 [Gonium pectorale]|eukprot:KXZ52047.1 hypothetical protein GPECTOR_10g1070 [Gonium pectorale]
MPAAVSMYVGNAIAPVSAPGADALPSPPYTSTSSSVPSNPTPSTSSFPSSTPASTPPSNASASPPPPPDPLLADVRVVLVAPKHAANVGAVARSCANFECLQLVLVAPRCDPEDGEARKVACGGGGTVLDRMVVRPAAAAAVVAATNGAEEEEGQREGEGQRPAQQRGAGEEGGGGGGDVGASGGGAFATALVFGREESGLTEAELRCCSHACAIPTGRLQPSMNLSHAATVVLAEIFSRRCGLLHPASAADGNRAADAMDRGPPAAADAEASAAATRASPSPEVTQRLAGAGVGGPPGSGPLDAASLPATAAEVDLLVRKVAAVAEAVGMSGEEGTGGGNGGNHGRRRLPVGVVRSVLGRARLSSGESRSLHGLASAALQALDPDHPLEARKRRQRQERQEREGERRQQPGDRGHGGQREQGERGGER